MSQYGILLPGFWDGETGRAIAHLGGAHAQVVAVYLMANQDTTMIGLYSLEPVVIQARIRSLKPRQIAAALEALRQATFADYDDVTGYVWVREMAKYRLGLHVKPMKRDDNRVEHVHRLYRGARPNPFLGPFFDRYAKDLFLSERRDYTPDPGPSDRGDQKAIQRDIQGASQGVRKGLTRGSEGDPKPVNRSEQYRTDQYSDQGTETENPDQEPRAGARHVPVDFRDLVEVRRHLQAAAHAALDADPHIGDGDLAEAVKSAAATLHVVAYAGNDITRIIDAVRGERARRRA